MRKITLDFNTHDLKRKIDLVIKYQFKIVSYAGEAVVIYYNDEVIFKRGELKQ